MGLKENGEETEAETLSGVVIDGLVAVLESANNVQTFPNSALDEQKDLVREFRGLLAGFRDRRKKSPSLMARNPREASSFVDHPGINY